jgi:hypothetical protein
VPRVLVSTKRYGIIAGRLVVSKNPGHVEHVLGLDVASIQTPYLLGIAGVAAR